MLGLYGKGSTPEIKEGEFDSALTYEVYGDTKKIEGTHVCKFDGVGRD